MKELIEKLDKIIDILEKKCNFATEPSNGYVLVRGNAEYFDNKSDVADYLIKHNLVMGHDPKTNKITLGGPTGIHLFKESGCVHEIPYRG